MSIIYQPEAGNVVLKLYGSYLYYYIWFGAGLICHSVLNWINQWLPWIRWRSLLCIYMHRQSWVSGRRTRTPGSIVFVSRLVCRLPRRSGRPATSTHAFARTKGFLVVACLDPFVTRHTMSLCRQTISLAGLTTSSPDNKSCMHEHDESAWQLLAS